MKFDGNRYGKKMIKWFMKHKYKIMIFTGLILTCCLFFELIKLACWIRVLINIASMIGSGVLCSAIVSWFVEKSNKNIKKFGNKPNFYKIIVNFID